MTTTNFELTVLLIVDLLTIAALAWSRMKARYESNKPKKCTDCTSHQVAARRRRRRRPAAIGSAGRSGNRE